MNKEFIPYEEALVLKELGFDEECLTFFGKDVKRLNSFGMSGLKMTNSMHEEIKSGHIAAPLWQQAFRFFREKYQLHNGIYPYYDEYEFQIKDFRLPTNTPINGGLMKYEVAELECLKKLIEIIKNDKTKQI